MAGEILQKLAALPMLTHLPWTKWTPFRQTTFSNDVFNENRRIPIQISLRFVPKHPIANKPALVQVMAWRRTGYKPLHEPIMTQFTNAYMQHQGELS